MIDTASPFTTITAVLSAVTTATGQAPLQLPGVNEYRSTCPKCRTPAALKIIATPGPDELHPATLFCVKCHRVDLRDIPTRAPAAATAAAPDALSRVSPDGRSVLALRRQGTRSKPDLSYRVDGVLLISEEFAIANPKARTTLIERVPESLREWIDGALRELHEAWSTTRPATKEKNSDDQPRLTVDIEPWPEKVDPHAVLTELLARIRQHLALPEHGDIIMALWIMMAHFVQHIRFAPYLWLTSPVPACGKTTALELLELTTPRPWRISNPTGAVMFRTIERERPTLLLDEIDMIPPGPKFDEISGVLNDGFHAAGKVARCVGEDSQVRTFSVYCAKAVAGILVHFHEASKTRMIQLPMARATGDDLARLTSLRTDRAERWAHPLRRQLARLAEDAGPYIADLLQDDDGVPLPRGIDGRDAQAWEPLIAMADLAGAQWGTMARAACSALVTARKTENDGDAKIRLLRDMRAFYDERGVDSVTSKLLIEWLIEDEARQWAEYRGKGLTPEALAYLLKPFGVKPIRRREFSGNHRVWLRADLQPIWDKYLQEATAVAAAPAAARAPLVVPRLALVADHTTTLDDDGYFASLAADESTLEPVEEVA